MDSAGPEDAGDRSDASRQTGAIARFAEWVKVDGNRLLLTAGTSVLIFLFLLALNAVGAIAFKNPDSITRMASGMVAGTFSLVTLVVSVNQLILSQEFSLAGEYRDRFAGVMEFRRDVEEHTGVSTTPVEPTQILDALAEATARRADELADVAATHPDEDFRRRVVRYTKDLEADTERISDRLDRAGVEAFDALSAAVEYDDDRQISAARALRNDAPELTGEMARRFDELIETLRLFSTAQEHFKTVYLQRELTRFSQLTIYCGVPAALAAALIALLYGDVGGATIRATYLPYATLFLTTIVFVPLVLLAIYILRTATLTRRTAATGPMLVGEAARGNSGGIADDEADG